MPETPDDFATVRRGFAVPPYAPHVHAALDRIEARMAMLEGVAENEAEQAVTIDAFRARLAETELERDQLRADLEEVRDLPAPDREAYRSWRRANP